MSVGDIDGDGDTDIVARHARGVEWWANPGGTDERWLRRVIDGRGTVYAVSVLDLDRDGDPDVVTAGYDSDREVAPVAWFENLGRGSDPAWLRHSVGEGDTKIYGLLLGDAEGDGDIDIVAGRRWNSFAEGPVVWFENLDSHGNHWRQAEVPTDTTSLGRNALLDLDGDGALDILAFSTADLPAAWFQQLPGEPVCFDLKPLPTSGHRLLAADISGDGRPDLLEGGDLLTWYLNDPDLEPVDWEWIVPSGPAASAGPQEPVGTADLDGDGVAELLAFSGEGLTEEFGYWNLGTDPWTFSSIDSVDSNPPPGQRRCTVRRRWGW